MNVSGLLRDGRGMCFLLFITFKRLEIVQWNFACILMTDGRVFWSKYERDKMLSEKSTDFYHPSYWFIAKEVQVGLGKVKVGQFMESPMCLGFPAT